MNCTAKDQKFVEMASVYAEESTMKDRIGSVVVVGGKFAGAGYNNTDRNVFDGDVYMSCHAEMEAMRQLKVYGPIASF